MNETYLFRLRRKTPNLFPFPHFVLFATLCAPPNQKRIFLENKEALFFERNIFWAPPQRGSVQTFRGKNPPYPVGGQFTVTFFGEKSNFKLNYCVRNLMLFGVHLKITFLREVRMVFVGSSWCVPGRYSFATLERGLVKRSLHQNISARVCCSFPYERCLLFGGRVKNVVCRQISGLLLPTNSLCPKFCV